jgi:signal transduction histidine kinase
VPDGLRQIDEASITSEQARCLVRDSLAEDRQRIARDLHDHVIQRVFAAALSLDGVLPRIADPVARRRVGDVVDQLDDAVRDIRRAIFDLRAGEFPPCDARRRLVELITETAGDSLRTSVRLAGPVDARLGDGLAADVEAVVREAVSNAVRHSGGTAVTVVVDATGDLVVEVVDDGLGLVAGAPRSGLRNLAERARRRGGRMEVTALPAGGTRLLWCVPEAMAVKA